MKFEVSGVIRVEDFNDNIINFTRENLVVSNKEYETILRLNLPNYRHIRPTIELFAHVSNVVYIPFGYFKDLYNYINEVEPNNNYMWTNLCVNNEAHITDTINLYDYQTKCVDEMVKAKNGILKAKCGSGKTLMGLKLISKLNKRTLWITHTTNLLNQTLNSAKQYLNCDIGTITDGKINIGNDLTIATIQTLVRMDLEMIKNTFSVVVVDEAHRFIASDYTKYNMATRVLSHLNARFKYGLTATPKDEKHDDFVCLKALFGDIASEIKEEDIGEKIIKARIEKIEVGIDYDIIEFLNEDGTLNFASMINALSINKKRNNLIVDNVIKVSEQNVKQVILCLRISQVKELTTMLKEKTKLKIVNTLNNDGVIDKNYDILISTYQKIKEGYDDKELTILHMAMYVKDKVSIVQSVGRVERNFLGKKLPICYYYNDSCLQYSKTCYRYIKKYTKE